MTKVIDTLTQEDFHGTFQKLLERYNKCIAVGRDYSEGDKSFMCVLSIKVPIQKKPGNLFYEPRIYYIYSDESDKIMETAGKFKQIYFNMIFWLLPFSEIWLYAASFLLLLKKTRFSRWSLNSVVIFGAVFLWSFQKIRIRSQRSLSDRFHFFLELCFSEEVFPSFIKCCRYVWDNTPCYTKIFRGFVKLAPAIQVPSIWPLLKSDRTAI